jgi:prepilin-type N-terminal cleavage/methylation domain-containing protein
MRTLKGNDGYTLTELAIAAGIVAILGAIAYPSFRTIVPRFKFQNDSNLLATHLNLVRLQAVSRNREYKVLFSTGDDRYTVFEGNKSQGSTSWTFRETRTLADADIYQIQSIPANALVYTPDGSFDETGEASPDGLGFVYTKARDNSMERRFRIAAGTGRLTVERNVAGAWKDERYLKE